MRIATVRSLLALTVWQMGIVNIVVFSTVFAQEAATDKPSVAMRDASSKSSESHKLADQILAANRLNNEGVGAFKAQLAVTLENPNVKDESTKVIPLGSKRQVRVTQFPSRERLSRLVVGSDSLRSDELKNGALSRASVFHNQLWTEYDPSRGIVTIRRPDQMPGIAPIDPRLSYINSVRLTSLPQIFEEFSLLDSGQEKDSGTLHQLVRIELKSRDEHRLTLWFDLDRNSIPVKGIWRHGKTDAVLSSTTLQYRSAEPRTGWMFETSETIYSPAEAGPFGDQETLPTKMTRKLSNIEFISNEQLEATLNDIAADAARTSDLSVIMHRDTK